VKVLILEQQHEAMKANIMNLEKEVARYKAQTNEVSRILSDQDDAAAQLEFSVKLLESRI
jgi:Tfp pilus assembly protein PilN